MKNLGLNILKIKDEFSVEEVKDAIFDKMKNKSQNNILKKEIRNETEKYNLEFFFYMNESFSQKIDWYEEIKELFDEDDDITKNIFSGYGLLLVHNKDFKYVITFGRATFIISEYIDWNFGLTMASKMLNPSAINAQSSKFFSLSKNKSLVIYNSGNFNTEAGESVDYITANIEECASSNIITELLKVIDRKVNFSGSIKVVCIDEELTLNKICTLIYYLDNILKKYIPRIDIPKLNFLSTTKDMEIICKLEAKLTNDIIDQSNICNISLGLYTILDSNFIFLEQIIKYTLIYKRKKYEFENLTIEEIKKLIQECEITNIHDINLKIETNEGSKNYDILRIIDYTTELESEDGYFCLYDGKWAKFNKDYVQKVENDFNNKIKVLADFDEKFNFETDENDKFINLNYEEMLKYLGSDDLTLNNETRKKLYNEFVYNYKLSKENNAKLLDRRQVGTIEVCDLYIRDNELIHTKIGGPGKFNECINQSIIGAEYWSNNKENIKKELGIDKVDIVTLLLLSDNSIVIKQKDISKFRSLRFKLNVLDWYNRVDRLNLKPRIIVGEYT